MAARLVWYRGLELFVLGLLSLACSPAARGAIGAEGYAHNDYAYRVLADKSGRLMSESWKLDNFYEGEKPGTKEKTLLPKDTKDYVVEYSLDENGDGEFETKIEELIYDLRFKHLVHDGVIFLRTIPISTDLRQKKLAVLMDRYVEEIAGAGYEVVSLNSQSHLLIEKRYAAAIVSKGEAKLAEREAYVVVLDVANLDQIKVDPNARRDRVELVLLRTDFEFKVESVNKGGKTPKFPVVMFAGYANVPAEFDAGLGEFHDFLGRVEINGRRGFTPPALAELAAPAAAKAEGAEPVEKAAEERPAEDAPASAPADAPRAEPPSEKPKPESP